MEGNNRGVEGNKKNHTWELVTLPQNKRPIGVK